MTQMLLWTDLLLFVQSLLNLAPPHSTSQPRDTTSARISTQEMVRDHLSAEVVELEEKVDRWMENTKHTASDALDRAMVDFKDLRSKSRLFAMALEMRAGDLMDRIDRMESPRRPPCKPKAGRKRTWCDRCYPRYST